MPCGMLRESIFLSVDIGIRQKICSRRLHSSGGRCGSGSDICIQVHRIECLIIPSLSARPDVSVELAKACPNNRHSNRLQTQVLYRGEALKSPTSLSPTSAEFLIMNNNEQYR